MSGSSSSAAAWFTRLEPAAPYEPSPRRPDDPRLGECVTFWDGGGSPDLHRGWPALVGFPQDEGVRRNGGRAGAAEAPAAIRRRLYALAPWDPVRDADLAARGLLDLGDVRASADLEASQAALAAGVAAALAAGAVPVVLGGGHETAYGCFLGYIAAGRPVGVVNLDAHLDVRPCLGGLGHSGSPFRQALEHPTRPLGPGDYVCLGAQPHAAAREHVRFARRHGCVLGWLPEVRGRLAQAFAAECERLWAAGRSVHFTLDADAVHSADVPGVSAPNADGLPGAEVLACVERAGASPAVAGFDLSEINPRLDPDGRAARWAAVAVWRFLVGLALRPPPP
jgi:formiminoglutamase